MTGSSENNDYLIPAAMQNNAWQLWLCGSLYLSVALVALIGFVQSLRLKGTYFRASFLGVSFVMCCLRGILVIVDFPNWEDHMFWLYLLNLFLPVYLQFWTFSLLLLFVAKCLYVIHDEEHKVRRWTFYPLYHAVQAALFAICVVVSYLLGVTYSSDNVDVWDKEPTLYVSVLYGLLALLGALYSYKCYRMLSLATPSIERQRQLARFYVLIPMYLFIFACRCMWNVLYYAGANPAQSIISGFIRNHEESKFDWAFLLFYSVFEIIPSAVVVYIFTSNLLFRSNDESGSPRQGYEHLEKYAGYGSFLASDGIDSPQRLKDQRRLVNGYRSATPSGGQKESDNKSKRSPLHNPSSSADLSNEWHE